MNKDAEYPTVTWKAVWVSRLQHGRRRFARGLRCSLLCEKSQGASKSANIQCWAPVKVHISQFFFLTLPNVQGAFFGANFG